MGRPINKTWTGTKDNLNLFFQQYNDAVKIKNAEIYWSDKYGALCVVTSQEWVDYFSHKRKEPPKKNNKLSTTNTNP